MKRLRPVLRALAPVMLAAACSFLRGPAAGPSPAAALFPFGEEGRLGLPAGTSERMVSSSGLIFLSTGSGEVLAVDPAARRVLWKYAAGGGAGTRLEAWTSGIMALSESGLVELLDTEGRLSSRLETGARLFSAAWSEGRLYCAAEGGRLICFDAGDGSRLWELKLDAPVTSGPLVEGGYVIIGDASGRLTAASRDGRALWKCVVEGIPAPGPLLWQGRIYFGTTERLLYCLSAATGKKKWALKLGAAPVHQPAVLGKRLFLAAANSVLYCLSARSGEVKWWQPVRSRLVWQPVLAAEAGLVLVSGDLDTIAAYEPLSGAKAGEVRVGDCPPAGLAWTGTSLVVMTSGDCGSVPELVFLRPNTAALR